MHVRSKRPADFETLERDLRRLRLDGAGTEAIRITEVTPGGAAKRRRESDASSGAPSRAPSPEPAKRGRAEEAPRRPYASEALGDSGALELGFPDGMVKVRNPDDSVVHRQADGSVSIAFGHGVTVHKSASGVSLDFPDGGRILNDGHGPRAIPPFPGMGPGIRGAVIERLDGGLKVRITFPDRVVTHDSDGRTVTRRFLPPDVPAFVPDVFVTEADGRHGSRREG